MACKHADKESCKLLDKKCIFLSPDEQRCSDDGDGIINYLKAIGTYESVVNTSKL